jgi:PPP family 3-phenylpropionic acid transporter
MPPARAAKSDDSKLFATRLALFYAALFIGFGLHQPFFPVWLKAKGLEDGQIGWVLAGGLLIRLIATPVVTYLADRGGAISVAIVICASATMVTFLGVGLADNFAMILIGVIITGFVWSPMVPLSDAYGLAGVAKRALDYGRIRVWGSVAFMGANLVGGLLLLVIAPVHIVWMIALSLVPLVAASLALVPDKRDRSIAPSGPGYFNRRFVLVMAASAFLQASHAVYYGFSSIHWRTIGYSGATVGMLWAVAVFAEIVLFWVATRFTRDWRPTTYLMIGGAGGFLRWFFMAFDPPLWLAAPLQVLHGAGFGLVHLGTMAYLAVRLPPHMRASGQGTVSVAIGSTMALSTLVAGYLYARVDARAYLAMAALCVIGLAVTVYARSLPIERPQPQREEAGG